MKYTKSEIFNSINKLNIKIVDFNRTNKINKFIKNNKIIVVAILLLLITINIDIYLINKFLKLLATI